MTSSCATSKLKKELATARDEYVIIPVEVELSDFEAETVQLLVYQIDGKHSRLVEMRAVSTSQPRVDIWVPDGDYVLIAFVDEDGDEKYRPPEPAVVVHDVDSYKESEPGRREHLDLSQFPANRLVLSSDAPDITWTDIDISVEAHSGEGGIFGDRFLSVLSLDDERFSAERSKQGMWEPLTWIREVDYGLYLTEPRDPARRPVVFVHGIADSPAVWQGVLESFESTEYQPVLFHYPTGVELDYSAHILSEMLVAWMIRDPQEKRIDVVAHSMGGLVARKALLELDRRQQSAPLSAFVTISTPWAGHGGAETGLKMSPVVQPVWKDMAPSSAFLRKLFEHELPEHVRHTLLFGYEGSSLLTKGKDDGTVSLRSMLDPRAQAEAADVRALQEDHMSILESKRAHRLLFQALAFVEPSAPCPTPPDESKESQDEESRERTEPPAPEATPQEP